MEVDNRVLLLRMVVVLVVEVITAASVVLALEDKGMLEETGIVLTPLEAAVEEEEHLKLVLMALLP